MCTEILHNFVLTFGTDLCKRKIFKILVSFSTVGFTYCLFQGDIQAEYDAIDKETPTGTDRQVKDDFSIFSVLMKVLQYIHVTLSRKRRLVRYNYLEYSSSLITSLR